MRLPEEMSQQELEYHIDSLQDEVDEYHDLLDQMESLEAIRYAVDEGFVEIEEADDDFIFIPVAEAEVLD